MRRIFTLLVLCAVGMSVWAATTIRMGVLLPLKEHTNRGTMMVELYRGLLMAVEQVKGEGTSVEVFAYDCGTTASALSEVLKNKQLERLDVLFGPADASQVATLAAFCQQHGIRMVLPFNTPCPQIYGNPWIYQAGVSQELLYPGVTSLVMEHLANSNFVMCASGEDDSRASAFMNHLDQVLNLRGMQTSRLNVNADELGYEHALNQFRNNVIVMDSRSHSALNKVLAGVKSFMAQHPQYKVSLLGYPEWTTYTSTTLKDFYQFDTYVFSSYYRNPLSGRVVKFEQRYRQNFGTSSRNVFPRAEMIGYDLGYYFLHGLGVYGSQFDEKQGALEYQPVQNYFKFQRVGEQGGYVNLHVQLVHYTPNNTIQVVR